MAIGAMLGAALRWSTAQVLGPDGYDPALLIVNIAGTAALGALTGLRPGMLTTRTEALLGAGVCGALTTWSALALRTAQQYHDGRWAVATIWLAANLVIGFAVAAAARSLLRRAGGSRIPGATP